MAENKCVSVVVVWTKEEQIAEAEEWIKKQSIADEIEIIAIDNRQNKAFPSAAKALNAGAEQARGDILIFMHQDIYLWDLNAVKRCVEFLNGQEEDTIIGAAGMCAVDLLTHYDLWQTKEKKRYALPLNGQPMEAVTLDECFIAMKKSLWQKLRFDEETCDNWHLYAVDICYANALQGGKNIIFPLEICHESIGDFSNKAFYRAVGKMIKKYRGKLDKINTTCISLKCTMGAYRVYVTIAALKDFTKKIGIYPFLKGIRDKGRKKRGEVVFEVEE